MLRAIPSIVILALFGATAAVADIPPPPYNGPTAATLAGLDFERGQVTPPFTGHYQRPYAMVMLKGCRGRSRNCVVITRSHVTGWGVIKIDGGWLSFGDIGELKRAFAGRRTPVKLLFRELSGGENARQVELSLDPR